MAEDIALGIRSVQVLVNKMHNGYLACSTIERYNIDSGGVMAQESIFRSFRYAWNGIRHGFAVERNMKIHLAAAFLAIGLAWYLEFSWTEMAVVILTVTAVLAAEMMNTALETVVDLVSPEYHPLAGLAKDIAAGAVLLTALASIIIGCLLYIPHLVN